MSKIIRQLGFSPYSTWRQFAKRAADLAICLITMPIVFPVMAICALLIRLDSPGPALFVQERIGKGGRPFRIYKLRTMRANLDTTPHQKYMKAFVRGEIGDSMAECPEQSRMPQTFSQHLRSNDAPESGTVFKPIHDSQITRVGRILRKTSLDELPQIFNVLKGEMSFVGPRPNVPWEVEEYQLWHSERFDVLPGITGLAQVKGRSSISFGRIVKYDIEYIAAQNPAKDLLILLRTVLSVFTRKGAK